MKTITLTEIEYYMLLTILRQISQMRGTVSAFYARNLLRTLQKGEQKR